jgi:hypothetical protein
METDAQEPIQNPPAFISVGLAAVAAAALVVLFKADWNLEISFFTALGAAVGALLAAVVAIGWSIAKRGQGWLAAIAALLASAAALGWVAWTFLILVRSAA